MKVLAIIALSIMIIIASLLCLMFSVCAAANPGVSFSAGDRVGFAVGALATLASIIGMVKLIRKLNRTMGL